MLFSTVEVCSHEMYSVVGQHFGKLVAGRLVPAVEDDYEAGCCQR